MACTAVFLSDDSASEFYICNFTGNICSERFDTLEEAEAFCNPPTVPVVCCEAERPEGIAPTMTVTLSGGEGTVTLTDDGSAFFVGDKVLGCGEHLYLRYARTCGLEYSCNDTDWVPASKGLPDGLDCGPPFVDGEFSLDLSMGGGCGGGACGTLTATLAEDV